MNAREARLLSQHSDPAAPDPAAVEALCRSAQEAIAAAASAGARTARFSLASGGAAARNVALARLRSEGFLAARVSDKEDYEASW